MKVCAWDIGIKNLAYCIIESDTMQIEYWEIISLINRPICTLNNTTCTQTSIYKYDKEHTTYGLCKNHIKNIKCITQYKTTEKNIKCSICDIKACYKYNDEYYCSTHIQTKIKEYCNSIHLEKLQSSKNITFLCDQIFRELIKRPHLLQVDDIIIENQPCFMNPTMKTLATIIYSYFMYHKVTNLSIKTVKFESPMNKLKSNTSKKMTYTERKKASIHQCIDCIQNTSWFSFLNEHSKKDDLSDAYLFAYHYIQKK
jgi:hypothetical protein